MGCGSSTNSQQQLQQMPQGQGFSNTSPMGAMPRTSQFADDQTEQMITNMQRMRQSGIFDTPYQQAQKAHPFMMGLSGALQTIGQGMTHQPFYTANQENQASLQNTQMSGMNTINTLPAQLRMMMAMQGMSGAAQGAQAQGNIPGITPLAPVISTPSGAQAAQANPMAVQMAAAKAAGYSDNEIQQYLGGRK